eukprot:625352-Rhodomonas_salina.1
MTGTCTWTVAKTDTDTDTDTATGTEAEPAPASERARARERERGRLTLRARCVCVSVAGPRPEGLSPAKARHQWQRAIAKSLSSEAAKSPRCSPALRSPHTRAHASPLARSCTRT